MWVEMKHKSQIKGAQASNAESREAQLGTWVRMYLDFPCWKDGPGGSLVDLVSEVCK